MARLTKKVEKNFTVVHNAFIRDKKLGLTARGLLLTMLSMSDSFSFSIKGLASLVPDGETKVSSALKELEKHGYLRRTRLFAKNGRFLDVEYAISDEPIFLKQNTEAEVESVETVENSTPECTQPYSEAPYLENPNVDTANAENPKEYKISKKEISNIRNTDVSTINPSISDATTAATATERRKKIDWMEMNETQEEIKEQIEMQYLLEAKNTSGFPLYEPNEIEELVQLIAWVYLTPQDTIRINGTDFATEVVRSVFHKLDEGHIIYVLDCLKSNTVKISARRNYLLTTLYNAVFSIDGYYRNQVQHDLYGNP